jgi:hypothetical protein
MTWPSCCSYRRARCRKDRAVLEDQNQQCCESEPYIRAFVQLQRASRSKLAADDLGHIPANAREHPTRSRRPAISHGRARSSGSVGGVRSHSKSVLRVRVFGGEQDQVDRLLTPVPLRSQANAMPPPREASARRSAESDSALRGVVEQLAWPIAGGLHGSEGRFRANLRLGSTLFGVSREWSEIQNSRSASGLTVSRRESSQSA